VFLILILNILKELTILSLIFSLVNFCSATMASKKDRGKGKIVNPSDNKSEHYSVEGDSSFDFKNWSIPRLPDKEFTKPLGLKVLSELNMLLKLLNKPFLFPIGMKILNSLIRDLLTNLLLKASSFYMLELSKLLLNH